MFSRVIIVPDNEEAYTPRPNSLCMAGHRGKAFTQAQGLSVVGKNGTARAGLGGYVMGGLGSTLQILHTDGELMSMTVGLEESDRCYALNDKGEFIDPAYALNDKGRDSTDPTYFNLESVIAELRFKVILLSYMHASRLVGHA